MAATLTVNRQCSRCPRVEQTEVSIADVVKWANKNSDVLRIPEGPKVLSMKFGDRTIEFPFLCTPCTQIVSRYIDHVAKKPKHQSALRGEMRVEVEED